MWEVPRENLLGKEGQGFKIAMATLDGGRIGVAAQALGIAQGAYENAAVAYAKERVQFGKPMGFQQGVSFKLADMATKSRCARFLVYSAAEQKEAHVPYGMEAAMAKMYASDIALEVTNDALCRSTAAPGLHEGAWRWNGPTGTPRSPPSTRAPTRSSGWSLPPTSWARPPRSSGRLLQPAQETRARSPGCASRRSSGTAPLRSRWPPWWST